MSAPIFDPKYWKMRLHSAPSSHQILCICGEDYWKQTEEMHRQILAQKIGKHDSILDAGCAYGRLIDLLPKTWKGDYLGVDLSPDFIAKAKTDYPKHNFFLGDLRYLEGIEDESWDWAICVSIKQMVVDNVGEDVWLQILAELERVSRQVLVLEYGSNLSGSK